MESEHERNDEETDPKTDREEGGPVAEPDANETEGSGPSKDPAEGGFDSHQ